jgi:hypothetical protein
MENVENKVENTETTKEVENTQPTEEKVEDKFIVLQEKLVQDIMSYLGTRPANEVVHLINGVSATAQYATMQPAAEAETTESDK